MSSLHLFRQCDSVTISGGGVIPTIHVMLLPKKSFGGPSHLGGGVQFGGGPQFGGGQAEAGGSQFGGGAFGGAQSGGLQFW